MEALLDAAAQYNYLDQSSWASFDDINEADIHEWLLSKGHDVHKALIVYAFHQVWNHEDTKAAKQIAEHLLKVAAPVLHAFIYFVLARACYVDRECEVSLIALQSSNGALCSSIDNSEDYRQLLTAIGSFDMALNGIEYSVMRAIILNEKGINYFTLKKFDQSAKSFQAALNLQLDVYPTAMHANIAYTRRWLGKSLFKLGMRDMALEQYEQALKIASTIYSDTHPEFLEVKEAIASVTTT